MNHEDRQYFRNEALNIKFHLRNFVLLSEIELLTNRAILSELLLLILYYRDLSINFSGEFMQDYHEPANELSAKTRDQARALNSFKEEIEAIDWYNQRIELAEDENLKEILIHNRNEEMEHAIMMLEWLRKNMDNWDKMIKDYLYTDGKVHGEEDEDDDEKPGSAAGLNIGKL